MDNVVKHRTGQLESRPEQTLQQTIGIFSGAEALDPQARPARPKRSLPAPLGDATTHHDSKRQYSGTEYGALPVNCSGSCWAPVAFLWTIVGQYSVRGLSVTTRTDGWLGGLTTQRGPTAR